MSRYINGNFDYVLKMAPIRRYLRISPYSVLEVRIYLDNPADAYRWLLRPRDPVLPRVIEAARPYVLPKLREENDRAKKGGKRKGFKDIAYGGIYISPYQYCYAHGRKRILRYRYSLLSSARLIPS